ncbi:hypothetical protein [Ancylobacter oerskovii]|uniref:CheA signal transduction histidine kinase n=1 Tax=Ancylobacter oerskovii TaxID=459519 RepID=A0ABW4YS15_9HYPH|nr:hypothetical protein [Ancylobacter oerskovii]MBS7545279.1 hypothetical protein [Ancylobacter oerskovii]
MADYYPLLARAIEQQPNKGREAREVIYARARKALLVQLNGANPPMPEEDIARQKDFLEAAIRRVEADHGGREAEPAPAAATPASAAPKPEAPKPASAPAPATSRPAEPEAAAPKPAAPSFIPQSQDVGKDRLATDRPATGPSGPAAGSPVAAGEGEGEADELWAGIERPPVLDEDEADARAELPDEASRKGRTRLIIGAAAALVLLLAIGGGLYSQRDRLAGLMQGGSSPSAPSQQAAQAPAGAPAPEAAAKSTDRVAQAPSTAPTQQPAAPPPAVQSAPRAMLLEEATGAGQGLQQFVGKVDWSTETFQPGTGQPQDVGIKAVIDIPDRNFKATMTIRRNPDPNIPASHIVEVQFQLPSDFDYGNVASVPGMQAMASEGAQGAPLRGLAVRVAPGYFLIGLLSGEREQQYNLSMMFSRGFLNVPVVFENGRRAILVVEKGASGEEAFRTAFSAWGLLRPSQQPQPQQPNGN